MSNPSRLPTLANLTGVLLLLLCTASIARVAYADPSGRVARLDDTQGEVSYSPAGENEWVSVVRNRPLIRGDRLWTDRDARAEFQVGSSSVRLDADTSLEILDLTDQIAQLQLSQGTLNLDVRRIYPGQTIEVDTPTLAFTINRAGRYRIDVDPRNAETTIVVWEGAGEANGENSSFPLRAGDTVRFYDTDLRDYELYDLPREDDFDRYCLDRDRRLNRSASLRYIDDDVIGYQDLDEYGSWRPVRSYGNVWFPSRVDADWAPYRDGHWVWQEPWGWTWVDNAPWGFAPSHYGRWVNVSNRWGWVPGPRNVRPVYAPALVAFVGGSGWSISISRGDSSPIGWFPLGPREVYVPSYHASRDYFKRVNVNNTAADNRAINNGYDNYSRGKINVDHERYANRTIAGAVTAVPRSVFVNAQPVRHAAIRLDHKAVTTGEVSRVAPIAPSRRSVIGAGTVVKARPSREALDRRVFARNAPPPSERPFSAREQQLQKNPGRVPVPDAGDSVRSRGANATRNIRVIGDQQGAVNARAAASRRGGDTSGARPGTPVKLQPLGRTIEPAKKTGARTGDRERNKEGKGPGDAQQQDQGQRKAVGEKQAAEQQKAQRQRQTEVQQQEQRQRKTGVKLKATEQQNAKHQREAETPPQEQRQETTNSQRQGQVVTTPQEQRQPKPGPQQTGGERIAECERQARLRHEDERKCQPKAPPQDNPEHPTAGTNNR